MNEVPLDTDMLRLWRWFILTPVRYSRLNAKVLFNTTEEHHSGILP